MTSQAVCDNKRKFHHFVACIMNSTLVYKATNNKFMLPVYLLSMLEHIEFMSGLYFMIYFGKNYYSG